MSKFQDPIAQFLSEHRLTRLAGMEIDKRQKQEEEAKEVTPKASNEIIGDDIVGEEPDGSEEGGNVENLRAEINDLKQFTNLNNFFVDRTKKILLWFYAKTYGKAPITRAEFEMNYQIFIPDPSQRATIFDVLEKNGMIISKDGMNYMATERAERFLKFIGLITG
jgi:hypothetical protein